MLIAISASLVLSAMLSTSATPVLPAPALAIAHRPEPTEGLARSVVFEISLAYGSKSSPIGTPIQPGFLVESTIPGIIGVTSFMGLNGATNATARFMDSDTPLEVEILTANPARDVALIRLTPSVPDPTFAERKLKLAPGEPRNGQSLWTLRASPTTGEVAAKVGLISIDDQGSRRSDRPFDAPGWLFATENNRQYSGSPLVDEEGRLAGINTWGWPSAQARPLGLNAVTVDDLFKKYQEAAKNAANLGKELKPIKVRDARREFGSIKSVGTVFPVLRYDHDGSADKARGEAAGLLKGFQCTACEGDGTINEKTRERGGSGEGSRQPRPPRGRPGNKCKACEGTGIKDKEAVVACAQRVARAITDIPLATDEYEKVLDQFAESAKELPGTVSSSVTKYLTEESRKWFDPERSPRGDAIMFTGSLSRDPSLAQWEKDVAIITPASGKARIMAIAPEDVKLGSGGGGTLFVGVIAGVVTGKNGEPWIVLDRVTAVPMESGRFPR
ncbi:MAG TPA: hypothetical protein VK176_07045 [Phycisphaerales bacterium]|nr:hypothetical protein [Phycisphaerales bacterium]